MAFDVIPSIDLRAGRVVRLRTGDFRQETDYGADPVAVAEGFVQAGARWIHLVDLDGARGQPRQAATIDAVVRAVGGRASCEVGGGIRSAAAVADALGAGPARVVLGTALLRDPSLARALVDGHGSDAIAAALDVRDGQAVGEGWVPTALGSGLDEALAALAGAGIARFVVTSVARDGTLAGPDLGLLDHVVGASRGAVIASGGIRTLEDLRAVRELGCSGAIVGRAVYDGVLDLPTAIRTMDEER